MTGAGPRVVIAGDDQLAVDLVSLTLDRAEGFEVVDDDGEADVSVIADPGPSAWRAARERGLPVVAVVAEGPVTVDDELTMLLRGADAVVSLEDDSAEVVERVTVVASGGSALDPRRLRALLEMVREGRQPCAPPTEALTARESQILRSIDDGESVKQTARTLGISPKTVENLQSRLFRKLGVRNRAQAVSRAHELGLLDLHVVDLTEEE